MCALGWKPFELRDHPYETGLPSKECSPAILGIPVEELTQTFLTWACSFSDCY